MAPPQVDLQKKPAMEELDVQHWAQKLPAKLPPLPASAPYATVPVETGTTVAGNRCCGKKRGKKCCVGIIAGIVAVVLLIAIPVTIKHIRHHRKHHRGGVEDGGFVGEEYWRMEGSKQVIYFARNETDHFFRLQGVLDYGTKMAGFKDDKGKCYVDRLRETYEEGCERSREYMEHNRRPKDRPLCLMNQISPEVLNYIVSPEVSFMCQDLPTYWVAEKYRYEMPVMEKHGGGSSGGSSSHEDRHHRHHESGEMPEPMQMEQVIDDEMCLDVIYL